MEGQIANWEADVNVASLSATIDGDPVQTVASYLVHSGHFTPGAPEDGSLLEVLLDGTGVDPNDDLEPSASSGYWLMIEGLTPGNHEISVSGTVAGVATTIIDHIFIG